MLINCNEKLFRCLKKTLNLSNKFISLSICNFATLIEQQLQCVTVIFYRVQCNNNLATNIPFIGRTIGPLFSKSYNVKVNNL